MLPPSSLSNSAPRRLAPGARLLVWIVAIAFCWLIILPHLARTPAVRTMIDRNDALGIDPSAKFYSELPLMPRVMDRIQAKRGSHSERSEESGVTLDSSLCSE